MHFQWFNPQHVWSVNVNAAVSASLHTCSVSLVGRYRSPRSGTLAAFWLEDGRTVWRSGLAYSLLHRWETLLFQSCTQNGQGLHAGPYWFYHKWGSGTIRAQGWNVSELSCESRGENLSYFMLFTGAITWWHLFKLGRRAHDNHFGECVIVQPLSKLVFSCI